MRIVNIMLAKGKGGLQQVALDYAKVLANEGNGHQAIQSHLITNQDAYVNDHVSTKVRHHIVKVGNQFNPISKYRIKKLIGQIKPDYIITHGNRATRAVYYQPPCPIIAVAHNDRIKGFDKLSNAIGLSDFSIHRLRAKGVQNIAKINNKISIDEDNQPASLDFAEPIIISTLARLHHVKGVDTLINSASLLPKDLNFVIKIAGDGGEKANLQQLINQHNLADKVELMGWLDDSAKAKLLQATDIFISSSKEEPFGLVFLEAMQYSLPIIATKTEGSLTIFAQCVTADDTAILVEQQSPKQIADAILHIINNQQQAINMGKRARLLLEANYNAKTLGEEIIRFLKQCV